jgi:hypothetical protein
MYCTRVSVAGLFYSLSQFHSAWEDDNILNEASFLARNLVQHIGAAVVTLGKLGVLVRTTLSFLRDRYGETVTCSHGAFCSTESISV